MVDITHQPSLQDRLANISAKNCATGSNLILEPYTYIASLGGKNFRGRLLDSFNIWLKVPESTLRAIMKIVNIFHTASLMIDDIEDNSELRRGKPVAHKIYGIPQTINAANYMYFVAFEELARIEEPPGISQIMLSQILTSELLKLHRGQGLDILWRDSLQCPTEDEYIDMVNDKTGGLLRIGVRLMMACATVNKDVDLSRPTTSDSRYPPRLLLHSTSYRPRHSISTAQNKLQPVGGPSPLPPPRVVSHQYRRAGCRPARMAQSNGDLANSQFHAPTPRASPKPVCFPSLLAVDVHLTTGVECRRPPKSPTTSLYRPKSFANTTGALTLTGTTGVVGSNRKFAVCAHYSDLRRLSSVATRQAAWVVGLQWGLITTFQGVARQGSTPSWVPLTALDNSILAAANAVSDE
uniref:(2E,6E)-farnesyl diphosphate synthase n=1 Tax=Mycena chlorophos TaxID=658473 RepID=A0ABQ0M057_MYCCL|nr:farnesyltranstransferase [Mycena chlorophos]